MITSTYPAFLNRAARLRSRILGPLAALGLVLIGFHPVGAQTLTNTAGGRSNGVGVDTTLAIVTLNRLAAPATSALAEISPNQVVLNSTANAFLYDVLPTIDSTNTGIQELRITAPAGWSNLSTIEVYVGGGLLNPACPAPGVGETCINVSGSTLSVIFGSTITATLTPIQIRFAADAPGPVGSGDFICELLGSGNPVIAVAGNSDGDSGDANSISVEIIPGVDPLNSTVTVDPPVVFADGLTVSTITTVLRDVNNQPVAGKQVVLSSSRGGVDILSQPGALTDAAGIAVGTIRSVSAGVTQITSTDVTDNVVALSRPEVTFTRGIVLELEKVASLQEASVGDVVTYAVAIKNLNSGSVDPVWIDDRIPPNFKFLAGSAELDGVPVMDPEGNRLLSFAVGPVPGLVDGNGNGEADPGEPGYRLLTYKLVVGSGARPGEYKNVAVARDVCESCFISNQASVFITVALDPILDLSTVIGKVFTDNNGDGWQDRGEDGVPGVMVFLDDGSYAVTDEFGRYHFRLVKPGHRLLKINSNSLPAGSRFVSEPAMVEWVSPGLLAKVNFGLTVVHDEAQIGDRGKHGVHMNTEKRPEPVQIHGNAEAFDLLVNGDRVPLPSGDVRIRRHGLNDVVELKGSELQQPVEFTIEVEDPEEVASWGISIQGAADEPARVISGDGEPPSTVHWDGESQNGIKLKSKDTYQYQLKVVYRDSSIAKSAFRRFGVNQRTLIDLDLMGQAFLSGDATLSPEAKSSLKKAAEILRQHPDDLVVISGHTDSEGSQVSNMELSRRRALAAADYFTSIEGIAKERLTVEWFGETRPVTANITPEGRALNRRVEIKGQIEETDDARLLRQYRAAPQAWINGAEIDIGDRGRFAASLPADAPSRIEVELGDPLGRRVETTVTVPILEIASVRQAKIPYGTDDGQYRVGLGPIGGSWNSEETILVYRVQGRTDPGNALEIDGRAVPVAADGSFSSDLNMGLGRNSFGVVARTSKGISRLTTILAEVTDRDAEGELHLVVDPVPNLTVQLPPPGAKITNPHLTVSGSVDPGSRVSINDLPADVDGKGEFSSVVDLSFGANSLVIRVDDSRGHSGVIEREIEVSKNQLFFMALADGVVGKLHGRGFLGGAGLDERTEYFTEGRVVYYLKGRVLGKYLLTSALDTGRDDFDQLLDDFDDVGNDRFLTNLDPDTYYPIYGDGSTTVYDAEALGKFFLAVESDQFNLLVGSYALDFNDTEFSDYQSTLYGGRVSYRSASETKYGEPKTQITVFGAQTHHSHVRTELRATGGSIYYLNHREVIEGSEQVAILVRDKNTGLVLSRTTQERTRDYQIKYSEGRIWFNRPIATVIEGGSLFDAELLSGHPVFLQIEYETDDGNADKTAAGTRLQRHLGDHFAVGGTYIKDDRGTRNFELKGVDGEVRLGMNTRLTGEYVESDGVDSLAYISDDGGLTYRQITTAAVREGSAWKAAIEADLGEVLGSPDILQVGGYLKRVDPGFVSSGNFEEEGTEKMGLSLKLDLRRYGTLQASHARSELTDTGTPSSSVVDETEISAASWRLEGKRAGIGLEYLERSARNALGSVVSESKYVTGRGRGSLTDRLAAHVEHQKTLEGQDNDQTTAGLEYELNRRVALQASGTTGTQGESAEGGLQLSLGESRVYLRERLSVGRGGRGSATVIGSQSQFGPATKVYSEYQWEHRGDLSRNLSVIGANRRWRLADTFNLLVSGEHARADGDSVDTRRSTLAMGLAYNDLPNLQVSSRNEVRYERGGTDRVQYFTNNHLEISVASGLSILGSYRYSRTKDRDLNKIEARFEERSLGLAYRPTRNDRVNALARYTRLRDERPSGVSNLPAENSVMDVVSAETDIELTRRVEWVDKFAAKIKRGGTSNVSPKTTTYLSINRLNFRLWSPVDLGVEYRILVQRQADDYRGGWLNELTWSATDHLRFGLGYNFTDFSDNEFSDNDYSVHGVFMRVQGKY